MAKVKISKQPKAPSNSVSLAGEFAVLSRLHLEGYDASMTLGNTKGVDILVSDPKTQKMYRLEVKTNLDRKTHPPVSHLFGRHLSSWIMYEKHESCARDNLWFCFVQIGIHDKSMKFFVVPSKEVQSYVQREHRLWRREDRKHRDNRMRVFRIGYTDEKYKIRTPTDVYKDNWSFAKVPGLKNSSREESRDRAAKSARK